MCCCLNLKFLKAALIFGGAIFVVLGILVIIGGAATAKVNKDLFPGDSVKYRNSVVNLIYIPGAFFILLGLVAMVSGYKQWKCLLCIFSFFTILIFLLCLACAVFGFVIEKYVNQIFTNTADCFKSSLLKDANQLFIDLKFIYCRTEFGKFTTDYDIPSQYFNKDLAFKVPIIKDGASSQVYMD